MWPLEPGAHAWPVLSTFGLCLEQDREFAALCAPVLVWSGSTTAQKAQEICCLPWDCFFSLLAASPSAGTGHGRSPSLAAPFLQTRSRLVSHFPGEAAALHHHLEAGGCQSWAWSHRAPGLRNCNFPHFHPGNRGKCFHPLQKIGPLDRKQSSSYLSHNVPGGGSHGNHTVAREPEGNCDLLRGEEGWGAHGRVGLAAPARPAADSPSCSPPVNHSPASYHSGFLFSASAPLAFPVGDPVRPSSVPFRKQMRIH